jgi:transposase
LSTKIHATVDAVGNPTGFFLTPGQACDREGSDVLLADVQADTVMADTAYDADERVIQPLEQAGKSFVIAPRSNRKKPRHYDEELTKSAT